MSTPHADGPLYLGFDLSTQQLKAIIVDSQLKTVAQAKADFDDDFGKKYGIHKGVHVRPASGEVIAPVAMWLEALDLVLSRLSATATASVMGRIRAVSGAGQQHGSVFWNSRAAECLRGLDPKRGGLVDQLPAALAHDVSPNWQDQSTQAECDAFDAALGGRQRLAERFTGTQIMRLRRILPEMYKKTAHISLVSSWLASVLLGALAPLDVSDVCGMNLWDMNEQRYSKELLALAAGGDGKPADDLRAKLGEPLPDGGASLGSISPYFVARYGFNTKCEIIPFTGDNPATILALPLRPLDAIVSLGTSTTFLMNTPNYRPDGSYHFFNHPTTAGHYMFMLCYKNGGLAREKVRDNLKLQSDNGDAQQPRPSAQVDHNREWDAFNQAVLETPPLDMSKTGDRAKMGLYFPLRETVPNIRPGTWRFTCMPDGSDLQPVSEPWATATDPRIITESQALSMRLRSKNLVHSPRDGLPAQPRRIYLVGGGSHNPAIARVLGDVLGGADGIYKLDVGGSACALGGAYKALWALEREPNQTFDDLIAARWKEEGAVERIGDSYRPETYAKYGDVLGAFEAMEQHLLAEEKRD
ncbi:Putative D-xylulose kinase A [Hirsutella minnesotensis 3608]|uniref:Xylulose kinase n=1 Tax=Hirsutella minnesotensis 3608 TaxID=1043627 RepID=A0A0F7ZVQ9_9HYPO|nr:Putative D-xylulose kinase A [Hirsutella minnesotensis 3608]